MPSVFSWSHKLSINSINRAIRAKKRAETKNKNSITLEEETSSSNVIEERNGGDFELDHFDLFDEHPDNYLLNVDVEEITLTEQSRSISIQCNLLTDIDIRMSAPHVEKCDAETNTATRPNHDLDIENFRDLKRSEELQFYTGFDNYEHFMFVYCLLKPQVNNLQYYPYCTSMKQSVKVLSPANEFFLTLIKLRRNMLTKELGYRFGISVSLVSRIFITWINLLFCQFKELNLWAPYSRLKEVMKFKEKNCTCTVIIDCTEIPIEKPKNPLSQQQTYSNYKSCNTLKILIGISPTGTVTFVSDAYGGATSDRQMVEKSGFLDLLKSGDVILADRGFTIEDLLLSKNVSVNIPEFVPQKKGQLEPTQLDRSKKISSKRIHVERLIGLAKTYRILCGPLPHKLVPLGSRIVFVCFMLINFRCNIM